MARTPNVRLSTIGEIPVSDDIDVVVRKASMPDDDLVDIRVRHLPSGKFGGGLTVPRRVLGNLLKTLKEET